MKKYSFAVDLGGTTAKCALLQNDEIITKFVVPTKIGEVIENIYKYFLEECKKLKITIKDFDFLAFTICGLLDYQKGLSIWSGNLQWENYPVVDVIKKLFQHEKVIILNDSKAATYGEYLLGLKEGKPNMLFYTIGTGIGGGVVLNHQLYFGNNTKLASEPGHSGGFQNEFQCNCGLIGCIEGTSSASGIERELNKELIYFQKKLNQEFKWVTIKDVAALIYENDNKTIELLKKSLDALGKHIAVSLHLMDFDVVVIGGGPSALGDKLIEILKEILKKYLLPSFFDKLDLRVAKLKNDAGLLGVYHYAKSQFNKN